MMGNDKKGFFDQMAEDLAKNLMLKGAVEASKDENGKIDIAKATGIAMGFGYTSDSDLAMLGAILGADGAFDDEDD